MADDFIRREDAYDIATLTDWLITSVVDDEPPVWTDEHIDELMQDFLIFPKDTPAADVRPVVHARWLRDEYGVIYCSECNAYLKDEEFENHTFKRCYYCGAMMDGEV